MWVSWAFAAVFAGVSLYFAVRLLASYRGAAGGGDSADHIADASHGVMGAGMAAMFWPWGTPMPALYWQVLFSMAAAWFAVRLLRRGLRSTMILQPDLYHMLGNLTMVYMLAAVPAGHGAAHSTHIPGISAPGIALPALAWAFVAYFLVFAVWSGARLVESVSTVQGGGPLGVVTSPHLLGSSHIVMGVGMSYMLVTML